MLDVKITANYLASLIIQEYSYHGVYLNESKKAFIYLCTEKVDFVIKDLQSFLDGFFYLHSILTIDELQECQKFDDELEIIYQNYKYALVN